MRRISLKEFAKRVVFILFVAFVVSSLLIVMCQDFLIFPMLSYSYQPRVPKGTKSEIRQMQAGNRLEVWSKDPDPAGLLFKEHAVAVLFCGNGGGLEGHSYTQDLFSSWGVKSYLVDYPGYGNSTGWPKEDLIYNNVREIGVNTMKREGIDPSRLIVVGTSIGTGVAAYLAKELQPKALVLFAGYSDFVELIKERNLEYRLLSPFLNYRFPTSQYVSQLKNTSLIAAHGDEDEIIPYKHLDEIVDSYRGQGDVVRILVPGIGHNSVAYNTKDEVYRKILDIWKKSAEIGSAAVVN